MKTVWNPVGVQDDCCGYFFHENTMVDFYGYAQEYVFAHSIVVIPAPISNPELTEKLKAAFLDAGLDYDKLVFDFETQRAKEQWCDDLADEELDPLFRRGNMDLPLVVLGHKYAVSAEDVISALKYQEHKSTLIMYGTDWTEVYALEEWSHALIKKRTAASDGCDEEPFMPTPWDLEQYDDLGLDPDEWSSPDQLDDDDSSHHSSFHIRRGYVVTDKITPVDQELPWWWYLPTRSTGDGPEFIETTEPPF